VRICFCWSVKALMNAHTHTHTHTQNRQCEPLKARQIFARRLRIFGAFLCGHCHTIVACNSPAVQLPCKWVNYVGKDILSLTQDILNIEITKGLIVMSNDYILHTYYTNTGCFATLVFCGTSQKTSGCLLLNNPLYPLYTLYT